MSKVIFTNSEQDEFNEILAISEGYKKKMYVYSKRFKITPFFKMQLTGFEFVALEQFAKDVDIFSNDMYEYLIVIKYPYLSNIMNRDIGRLQRVKTKCKLVIENHPFLSKSDVFWCYFPYSFFDKTLLGYPHSYAFRDAPLETNPFDVVKLAHKVSCATKTYMREVFDVSKIKYTQIKLTAQEHYNYQQLKEHLFETESTPRAIIAKLKRYVNQTDSMQKVKIKGYNPLYLNRVHKLYLKGIYNYVYSDSKVDLYLLKRFNEYLHNANTFLNTLWSIQNGI